MMFRLSSFLITTFCILFAYKPLLASSEPNQSEYDKTAIELASEMRLVMSESWACEEEFRRSGNNKNTHCQEAIGHVKLVSILSKIVPMDGEHPLSGLGKELSFSYMVSATRLKDTLQYSNPDLTIKRSKPEKKSSQSTSQKVELVISLSSVSWVSVKDSSNRELFNGLASPSHPVSVTGMSPLELVVGREDAIRSIELDGVPYRSKGVVKKNVLREIISP